MQWAVLRNDTVINIVEADSPDQLAAAYPGCVFEPAQSEHWARFTVADAETPSPALTTKMTKYQFRRRFSLDELVRFDNPELFVTLTPQQRAIVNTLQRSFEAATEIDLNDPLLQYGMQLMVDWGLLSAERKQQILDPSYTVGINSPKL